MCIYICFSTPAVAISAQPLICRVFAWVWAMSLSRPASPGASGASAAQALQFTPSAPGCPYDQIAFMNNIFYDVQTGAPIPQDTIMASLQRLDNVQTLIQESSKIYKKVIKSCPPNMDPKEKKKIAKARADGYIGARLLDLWDGLAADKVIITMVVTAPPAKDQKEAADNEDRLRCVILQVDQYLFEQMADL